MNQKKAVILLSGGLDSSTTLAIAKSQDFECYALTICYHQRNYLEMESAKKVAQYLGVAEHRIITLELGAWGGSALTDHEMVVPHTDPIGIPITYVPARNTIFLSTALAWAEVLGARDIFFGANLVDDLNYPDCRSEYIEAFEKVANLATRAGVEGEKFSVHAPLLKLTKSQIIQQGINLGVDYSITLSCYDPSSDGAACGFCDACRFRAQGFEEAGIKDVTRYSVSLPE